MSNYEVATLILQTVIGLAAFATLAVYYHQLKVMARQLDAMQAASRAQGTLALVEFLQSEDVRQARTCVRDILSQKALETWTDGERRSASLVCANYDVVAGLLKAGVASPDLIATNWSTSIVHCHKVLSPFVQSLRDISGDQKYWQNFDWLVLQATRARAA